MTFMRDPKPRSWDKESRHIRIFFDWLTMRDMRYVYLITGGSFISLAVLLVNLR